MTITQEDLARELQVSVADVSVLVDQLIDIDGHQATVLDNGELLDEAVVVIRAQLSSHESYSQEHLKSLQ